MAEKEKDGQNDVQSTSVYFCPFCKKKVKHDYEAEQGCKDCAEDWMINEEVDHPVG